MGHPSQISRGRDRFDGVLPHPVHGAATGQKRFHRRNRRVTPFTALQSNDEKALLDILGPEAKQIVSSGDDIEDAQDRANLVKKYQEMHRLVKEPDGTTTLYIGAENWPTPIPLVEKNNSWSFDTEAGKQEILFRRVGENELSTIRVCQELVAAEKEYYPASNNEYAQKIFSDDGQHNGLYWKVADGQPQSPIGPLVASAVAEGYTPGHDSALTPYRGLLPGSDAPRGQRPGRAKNYIVNGKMTNGFAFGLSGGVQVFRCDDIHRGSGWNGVSQRPRQEHLGYSPSDEGIQPRFDLDKGRRPGTDYGRVRNNNSIFAMWNDNWRLGGGGRSHARTLLRPISLLTGKNTGNLPPRTHPLSDKSLSASMLAGKTVPLRRIGTGIEQGRSRGLIPCYGV